MDLEHLFTAFNFAVTPFWLLMIVAPKWKWTDRIVHTIWIPVALTIWLIAIEIIKPAAPDGAGFGSLQAVMLLTNNPHGTLALWTQAMGWDLFVGMWIARDARRQRIHHGLVIPCLLATFILGPLGALLYVILRLALRRTTSLQEVAV